MISIIRAGQIGSLCYSRICYKKERLHRNIKIITCPPSKTRAMSASLNSSSSASATVSKNHIAPLAHISPQDTRPKTQKNEADQHKPHQVGLLYRVLHRVRELQDQAAEHTKEDAAKIIRELNEIKMDAKHDRAHAAAAKVLGIVDRPQADPQDWNAAQSMQDIGRKLLQSIGFSEPDDVSVQAAIEANDAFIARLEAIRDAAQGLTIDQDD
jgi:hypothetical protein